MATLKAQKRELRKSMTSALKSLSSSSISEQSRAIADRVLSLPLFQSSKSISCYLNMPYGEVQTSTIVAKILRTGRSLFVPKIIPEKGHMDFLRVHGESDLDSFPVNRWGINEPEMQFQEVIRQAILDGNNDELDLILLPGVVFDKSFSRLGHGKGYYDRFITSYISTNRRRPFLVALALREQVLEKYGVPVGEHDWKIDLIVTPDGILYREGYEGIETP